MTVTSKLADRRIAIIGAGKVGTAIGHVLQRNGFNITAVASRSEESLQRAEGYISGLKTHDIASAAKLADLVLITTNDDQIEPVCRTIAGQGGIQLGDVVVHCSGALSTSILSEAKSRGADTCMVHPLQSFAGIEGAISHLPGSVFGVTAEENVLPLVEQIVDSLGGEMIKVGDEDRALYHAAACVASNFFVSLIRFAQSIYEDLGVPNDIALKGLLPLIKGTLSNMELHGTTAALTGPIARGDMRPVQEHLSALRHLAPHKVQFYSELAKYTTFVALEKGTIDEGRQREFYTVLLGGHNEQEGHDQYPF